MSRGYKALLKDMYAEPKLYNPEEPGDDMPSGSPYRAPIPGFNVASDDSDIDDDDFDEDDSDSDIDFDEDEEGSDIFDEDDFVDDEDEDDFSDSDLKEDEDE